MRGQPSLPFPPPAPGRGAEGSANPCSPISLTKLSPPAAACPLQFILAANDVTNQSEFRRDSAQESQNRSSLKCCMTEPVTIQYRGIQVMTQYDYLAVSGPTLCSLIDTARGGTCCMCYDPRAPATQELQELSIGIPYRSACSPSRLVLSDHMQNSELY